MSPPDVYLAIVSSGRPGNVPIMEQACEGLAPVWFVPAEQAGDYRYAGASRVVAAGGLCESRNAALEAAADRPCLQMSDDMKGIGWARGPKREHVSPLTVAEAGTRMLREMRAVGAKLAGAAPTDNPYFSRQRVHETAFIVGDLILIEAKCSLRFDTALRLKEDYDYTLQHLAKFGKVARLDALMASFLHRRNRGGAVAFRTPAAEQEAIQYLKAKWPGKIVDNPKRADEVLMRWTN